MAVTRTDSGFTFSRGRKANRTTLDVAFRDIARWARRNRAEMPRLIRKASGTAASTLRTQLRKVMKVGGGIHGVPAFRDYEPFTKEYRTICGKSGPMGGYLAEKSNIVMFKRGNQQIVGWPDNLGNLVVNFQDGAGSIPDRFADKYWRQRWHIMGIADVPDSYTHNRRDVLIHYKAHIDANLKTWKKQILEKEIAKRLAKERGWSS